MAEVPNQASGVGMLSQFEVLALRSGVESDGRNESCEVGGKWPMVL